jgi:hypothetical protein
MSKIFHSTIVLAAFLAFASVSFAQEPRVWRLGMTGTFA